MYLPVCMGILTAPPSRKGVKTKALHFGSGKQLPNPGLVLVWGGGGQESQELSFMLIPSFNTPCLEKDALEIYLPRVGTKPPTRHCPQTPAHLRYPSARPSHSTERRRRARRKGSCPGCPRGDTTRLPQSFLFPVISE